MFDPIICPVCGKSFVPSAAHALTDCRGNLVCTPHCSNIAYDRRYGKKKQLTSLEESERNRQKYENRKNGTQREKFMKPVLVVKKADGTIMSRHPSVKEAAQATGFTPARVSQVCRGYLCTRGEYTFIYEKEEQRPKDGYAEYSRTAPLKPVLQFNMRGEFIARYESQGEASRATGVARGNISNCCTGRQYSAGGFIFRNESDFEIDKDDPSTEFAIRDKSMRTATKLHQK